MGNLHHLLTNHPVEDQRVVAFYEAIRADAKMLGDTIERVCPPSHDRDVAIDKLREIVFWAVSSIANNQALLNSPTEEAWGTMAKMDINAEQGPQPPRPY